MIAGAIAIDIAPALCSHSALVSIRQITLNTFIREKFGHRTHQNQGNSDDGEPHKSSLPPAGKLFKRTLSLSTKIGSAHFHFLQRYDKPAHFVSKMAKEIGADEVGDGSREERCSKLPLVTEAIIMIRISLDRNCHMNDIVTSDKVVGIKTCPWCPSYAGGGTAQAWRCPCWQT